MKKLVLVVIALALLLSLGACAANSGPSDGGASSGGSNSGDSSGGSSGGSEKKTAKIGVSNLADSNEFCFNITHGSAEKAAALLEADGYEVEIIYADQDMKFDTVVTHFENFISLGVDAIVTLAIEGAVGPAVVAANNAGIPSFHMTTKSTDGVYYRIGSSEYDLGYMQGKYLSENLKQNGKVVYMMNGLGSDSQIGRREGFLEGLKADGRTDINVISEMEADTQEKGLQVMEDWITAYPDFDAVVSQTDKGIGGAVEALKAAGRLSDDMILLSIDADSIGRNAVKNGEIYGSVAQDTSKMEDVCAEYIYQYVTTGNLDGVEENTIVPCYWVTAENVG